MSRGWTVVCMCQIQRQNWAWNSTGHRHTDMCTFFDEWGWWLCKCLVMAISRRLGPNLVSKHLSEIWIACFDFRWSVLAAECSSWSLLSLTVAYINALRPVVLGFSISIPSRDQSPSSYTQITIPVEPCYPQSLSRHLADYIRHPVKVINYRFGPLFFQPTPQHQNLSPRSHILSPGATHIKYVNPFHDVLKACTNF